MIPITLTLQDCQPRGTSSARDLATLTAKFINNFPDEYALYKEKQFTFNNIKQLNRNKLLWRDESSDGED